MPIQPKHPHDPPVQPTAPAAEEQAAMERALAREGGPGLIERLERENAAARAGAKAGTERRGFRKA